MVSLKSKFGARVRELRKALNMSQDKFADKIDWDKPNISNLENGKSFLKPESIEKISEALDVEVKDLFDFEHFKDKNELVNYINSFMDEAEIKDIRFLYKFIKNLKEYR